MTRVVRVRFVYAVLPLLVVGALTLGGCTQVADTAKSAASNAVSQVTATAKAEASKAIASAVAEASRNAASAASGAAARINPNTASQAQIAAALSQAGVPNADSVAANVVAARPIPAVNATAKINQLVNDAGLDPATVLKLVAAMSAF